MNLSGEFSPLCAMPSHFCHILFQLQFCVLCFQFLGGVPLFLFVFSFLNPKIPWSNNIGFTRFTYLGGPNSGAAAKAPWSFLYGNQIVLCQQKYESKTQMLHISAQCGGTPTHIFSFYSIENF